jgi:hypothetical protein
MSSQEYDSYFVYDEIEPNLRELQILNNIISYFNDEVLSCGMVSKEFVINPGTKIDIIASNTAESIILCADGQKHEIGYFDPVSSEGKIYSEFINTETSELQEIQMLAQDRRQRAIDGYNAGKIKNIKDRVDSSHPMITDMLIRHNEVLFGTNLIGAIADYHNFVVPGMEKSHMFDVDEDCVAAVYLDDKWLSAGGMCPNYELGLRIWGSYKKIGIFKDRTTVRNVPLAHLEDSDKENAIYIPNEYNEYPIIQDDHLEELVTLSKHVIGLKKYFSDDNNYQFKSAKLGLNVKKGKEVPLLFVPFH